METIKFCAQCGAPLEEPAARFCPECGQPVDEPAEIAAVPTVSAEPLQPEPSAGTGALLSETKPLGHDRLRKFLLPLLVVVVLSLAGFGVKSVFFKGHAISSPVVFAGGQVFYINTNDDYQIYRMNPDGSGKEKMDDSTAFRLVADGDWLYFSGMELFKIRSDGSEKIKLDNLWLDELAVGNGWLYAEEGQSDTSGISRRRTDGGQSEFLNEYQITNLVLEGDNLFYRNVDDNYTLYRTKIDGTDEQRLTDDPLDYSGLAVQDGWVYYANDSESSKLFRIRVDGTERTRLGDDYASYLAVSGEWIYYSNGDDGGKLYRIRTDGSKREKLNDVRSIYISCDGTYAYYAEADHGDRLSQVRVP